MQHLVLVVFIAAFIWSVILHEIAHGWAAKRAGDYTAEAAGRLSLNPIRHIDPMMTIVMPLLILWITRGAMIFGGAKPVPVNPYYFRNGEVDDLKVSLAGVTVNILIAIVAGLTIHLWQPGTVNHTIFTLIAISNLFLAFFNLIPIPPLDGSHVMRYLIARVDPGLAAAYERIGMFGFILVIFFFQFFSTPIFWAINFIWYQLLRLDVSWLQVIQMFRQQF